MAQADTLTAHDLGEFSWLERLSTERDSDRTLVALAGDLIGLPDYVGEEADAASEDRCSERLIRPRAIAKRSLAPKRPVRRLRDYRARYPPASDRRPADRTRSIEFVPRDRVSGGIKGRPTSDVKSGVPIQLVRGQLGLDVLVKGGDVRSLFQRGVEKLSVASGLPAGPPSSCVARRRVARPASAGGAKCAGIGSTCASTTNARTTCTFVGNSNAVPVSPNSASLAARASARPMGTVLEKAIGSREHPRGIARLWE